MTPNPPHPAAPPVHQPAKATLNRVSSTLGRLYGKHPAWAQELVGALEFALRGTPDADVDAAVAAWIDEHPDDPPTAVKLRSLVRQRATAQGTTSALVAGCGRCSDEGYRDVVLHLRRVAGDGPGFAVVRAVLCDCGRGAYFARRRAQQLRGEDSSPRGPEIQLARYLQEWRDRPVREAPGKPAVRLERLVVDPTPDQRVGEDVRLIAQQRAATARPRPDLDRATEIARRAHRRAGLVLADDLDREGVRARALDAARERAELDDLDERPEAPIPDDRAAWMGAADGDEPLDGPLY